MKVIKIIILTCILSSIVFGMKPPGTTLLGGWGVYTSDKIGGDTCEDCSYLRLEPKLNYFLFNDLSLDIDVNIERFDYGMENYSNLDIDSYIGISKYLTKNIYLKASLILYNLSKDNEDEGQEIATGRLFGIGYLQPLSKRVFFDVSYSIKEQQSSRYSDETHLSPGFIYALKVAL